MVNKREVLSFVRHSRRRLRLLLFVRRGRSKPKIIKVIKELLGNVEEGMGKGLSYGDASLRGRLYTLADQVYSNMRGCGEIIADGFLREAS